MMLISKRLQRKWEDDQQSFQVLSKADFDEHYRFKHFCDGPLQSNPGHWLGEFGPYNPHRWVFGQLHGGRFVCCDVAAEAAKEEK